MENASLTNNSVSSSNNCNMLQVEDLYVSYVTDREKVEAVNGISFSMKKGECLGIVGETGAGKTTTALSLLQLLPEKIGQINKGKIIFDGNDLLQMSENDLRENIRGKKISMIFQDPMTSLNPIFTVGEQIAEVLKYHNNDNKTKDQINQRVDETLELVGIPASRKHEYPHQFSGGMKQRVVIAMALACEPELLIADEPTTALDVTIQAQVLAMIQELQNKLNTAMLLITHDLGIVAQVCDNVAVMYAGELIESGTVEDIFIGTEHHPYTIGLFGAIPKLHVETDRLSAIDGLMPDPTNLPKGCKFAPRCPKCFELCQKEKPSNTISGTHSVMCHLYTGKI